jgi:hypothetical protein
VAGNQFLVHAFSVAGTNAGRGRECAMSGSRFSKPVSIFVGLGFPQDIETPSEAFRALTEWHGSRGPSHAMSINVCRTALVDETRVEAARIAFEAFARARGMLAPDAMVETAKHASEEWLPSR